MDVRRAGWQDQTKPRRRFRFRRSATVVLTGALLASLASLPGGRIAMAATYDNTNPGATPCGDGSHPVTTWRYFYIKSGGLIYARIDIRRSEYCNTVWTRAVNLTGSGSGYASAQSLTTDEQVLVYNCPKTTCLVHSEKETGDVLPSNGSSGWSHQFVLPSPGSLGSPAAKQPPTVRGVVTVHTSGGSTFSLDTQLEPVWTHLGNHFDNARSSRDGTRVLSCDNSSSDNCEWWGEALDGTSRSLYYYATPSLDALGTVDVKADIRDVLLPAWSQKTARSPILNYCAGSGCPYSVDIVVDTTQGCRYGGMLVLAKSSGTPAEYWWVRILIGSCTSYDHSCGTIDDGCTTSGLDDRILLSHEIGHSLGLGHCDLNYGVMCHVTSSTSSELAEGTSYWTPQSRDVMGLKVIYP